MIREKDRPYIQAVKDLVATTQQVTSAQLEQAVQQVNQSQFTTYYTAQQVVNIILFCEVATIQTHLGQPRHGEIINGGRVHQIVFRS